MLHFGPVTLQTQLHLKHGVNVVTEIVLNDNFKFEHEQVFEMKCFQTAYMTEQLNDMLKCIQLLTLFRPVCAKSYETECNELDS
jgi:hypothetical protein